MTRLADILTQVANSGTELPRSATVDTINADGTVDLLYLGGVATSVPVVSTYIPATGDVVQIIRRGPSSLIVIGQLRTANVIASSKVGSDLAVMYNVQGAPTTQAGSSGTFTFLPTSSGSYRTADKWGSPVRDELRQGAYFSSTQYGYYQGAWFYGSGAFNDLKGRTVTSVQITMRRKSGSGNFGAEPIKLYTTKNTTRPSGPPYYSKYIGSYALAVSTTGTFTLPDWVGNDLRSGAALGIGIRDNGTSNYLALEGRNEFATSGRLQIGWVD